MSETPKIRNSSALHVRLPVVLADYVGQQAARLHVSQSDFVRMTLSAQLEREAERVAAS